MAARGRSWRVVATALVLASAALLIAAPATESRAAGDPAQPDEFFVAPNGRNGWSGSEDRPWRTLTHAFSQLRRGDTLYMRGGTFIEKVTKARYCPDHVDGCPATSEKRIKVKAYPGEHPILKGVLQIRRADYWMFSGLDVRWDDRRNKESDHQTVKIMDGIGWRLHDSVVSGSRSYANVFVGDGRFPGPGKWRITDSCIHHNKGARTHRERTDHNLYLATGRRNTGGVVENTILFSAPNGQNVKIGIGAEASKGANNIKLRYNTMHDATQNVLVAFASSNVMMSRNLLGKTGSRASGGRSKSWYPNFRGYDLTGRRVVARENSGYLSPHMVRNSFGSNYHGARGIKNGPNNRMRPNPRYNNTRSCRTGFWPANRRLPFGAWYGRSH